MTKYRKIGADVAMEILGGMLIALGVYNFALEADFPMTGFSGISLLLYRFLGVPIGLSTVLLNVPVAILASGCGIGDFSSVPSGVWCFPRCSLTMWRPCCPIMKEVGCWRPSAPVCWPGWAMP